MMKTIQKTEKEVVLTGSAALVFLEVVSQEQGVLIEDITKNLNGLSYSSVIKILQKLRTLGAIKRIPNLNDMRSPLWVKNNELNPRCYI